MSRSSHDTGHSCDSRSIVGLSVQGPALRAVPVASRLHQSRGGGPYPPERTRCAHSQLPRRLAHTRTVSQAVVCTQGPGDQAPQPAGPSGQLGKEQTRANAEDLFSRHEVRFGQLNSTPHPGTCSVSTHYRFSMGTVHETGLYSEVEPVRRMVFLPPGGPPEMFNQSCAFLFTARVGA